MVGDLTFFLFLFFLFYWRLSGSLSSLVICRLPPAVVRWRKSKNLIEADRADGPVLDRGFLQHYRG